MWLKEKRKTRSVISQSFFKTKCITCHLKHSTINFCFEFETKMATLKQLNDQSSVGSPIPRFDALLSEVPSNTDGASTIVNHDNNPDLQPGPDLHPDPDLHSEPDLHPSTENTTRQNQEQESPTILQEVEQHLSSLSLNPSELLELTAGNYATSTVGSKSEYPDSTNYSSLVSQNLHSLMNDHSSLNLNGNVPVPATDDIKGRTLRYCVDLRERLPGVYKTSVRMIPLNPHQDMKANFAHFFQCRETELFDLPPTPQCPIALTVIKPRNDNLVLIVNFKGEEVFGCLMIGREASLTSGLRMCKHWVDKNFGGSSSHHICLAIDGHRLDEPRPFCRLSEFQVLDLIRGETLNLKLVCRTSQHSERVFYVDCHDTDYVQELMEKFLQILRKDQYDENTLINLHNMRLTFGERMAFPEEMIRNLWNSKEKGYTFDSHIGDLRAGETFHVHFQPPDAVLIKLNFKSDLRKYLKSESVILLSPKATAEDLRQEICRVIHRDPLSFKMFIAGRKIELDTDLQPLLTSPNCTVVVEQRSEILLKVKTTPDSLACFPVNIHKYERVETLKQVVCSHLGQPAHCIDLYHQQNRLDERQDLRGCRLRNQDTVQALVLPNRIRVLLRLGTGRWEEVVVNDTKLTTVEQLLAYAQLILRSSVRQNPFHQKRESFSEQRSHTHQEDVSCVPGRVYYKALLGGQILSDLSSLREAGVSMNSRVVLVQEDSLCCNMSCQGRMPVFFAHDSTSYQPPDRIMVMCDGKDIYIKYPLKASSDPPRLVSHDSPAPLGIERCSPELKAQFPRPIKGGTHLRTHCHVCKSVSLPAFPSQTAHTRVNHSQSCTFPGTEFSGRVNKHDDSEMLSMSEPQTMIPEHQSKPQTMIPEHHFEPQMIPEHGSEPQRMSRGHRSMPQMHNLSDHHLPEQQMPRSSTELSYTSQMHRSAKHGSPQQMIDDRGQEGTMDVCDGMFSPQASSNTPPGNFLTSTPRSGSNPGSAAQQPPTSFSARPQFYLSDTSLDDQRQEGKGNSVDGHQTPSGGHWFEGDTIHGQLNPGEHHQNSKGNTLPRQLNSYGEYHQNFKANTMPGHLNQHHQNFKANSASERPIPLGDCCFQANTAPREQTPEGSKQPPPANKTVEQWDLNHRFILPQTRRRHVSDNQYQSEGEASSKSVLNYKYQLSVEHDNNGRLVRRTQIDHRQQLSDANMLQACFSPFFNRTVPLSAQISPMDIGEGHGLPAVLPSVSSSAVLPDVSSAVSPAEAFIKDKTLLNVAKALGMDGEKVVIELLNDFNAYQQIEQRHGNDLFRKFYDCLSYWRQKVHSKDCVKLLKKVLEENDRADLVEVVDNTEALEQGYNTAP